MLLPGRPSRVVHVPAIRPLCNRVSPASVPTQRSPAVSSASAAITFDASPLRVVSAENRWPSNRARPPPSVPTHIVPRRSCSTGPVLLLGSPSLVVYGIARPSRNWFNPCLVAAHRLPSRSSYSEYTVLCD